MKNPKTNPEIEAIKASLSKELGYLPGDKIPNSNVSKALGMLDATATLIYAKTLKRKARFAKPGECQYTIGRKTVSPKPEDGLISTAKAAKILEVQASNLNAIRKAGKIKGKKIGGRFFFKPEEIERYRIQRAIDKL
ncbi:hypothetical protein [Chryseobacterium sp. HR92]|uniref:hypothetical protein n=1 Tax=Chryseobacterium sp. HR92 TaxID=3094839 RepID=UPI00388E3091|nr:hypothetical protein SFA27_16920 [Chryseobacterium sp. HR92]